MKSDITSYLFLLICQFLSHIFMNVCIGLESPACSAHIFVIFVNSRFPQHKSDPRYGVWVVVDIALESDYFLAFWYFLHRPLSNICPVEVNEVFAFPVCQPKSLDGVSVPDFHAYFPYLHIRVYLNHLELLFWVFCLFCFKESCLCSISEAKLNSTKFFSIMHVLVEDCRQFDLPEAWKLCEYIIALSWPMRVEVILRPTKVDHLSQLRLPSDQEPLELLLMAHTVLSSFGRKLF